MSRVSVYRHFCLVITVHMHIVTLSFHCWCTRWLQTCTINNYKQFWIIHPINPNPNPTNELGHTAWVRRRSFVSLFVVKMLCLKLLPHISSHLARTCYTWYLLDVHLHDISFILKPKLMKIGRWGYTGVSKRSVGQFVFC